MNFTSETVISCLGAIAIFAISLFLLASLIKGRGIHGGADYLAEKAEWLARRYEATNGSLSTAIWWRRLFSVFVVALGFADAWRRGLLRGNIPAAIMFALASVCVLGWYWLFPHKAMKREAMNARLMGAFVRHVPWIVLFLAVVLMVFGACLLIPCFQHMFKS